MLAWALAFGTLFSSVFLTSLGNLLVALSMSLSGARRTVLLAYVTSLLLALGLSLVLGVGADQLLEAEGWLGWPVLAYGLIDIWQVTRTAQQQHTARHVTLGASFALFCLLSVDTLAVLIPLLAEQKSELRLAAILGGLSAIAVMALMLELMSERLSPWLKGKRWLDYAGPVALILAGLYILLDTPTDAI
ncbi:MAG: hypothetical protein AAGF79_19505 [Pseudomonadota bacterium]